MNDATGKGEIFQFETQKKFLLHVTNEIKKKLKKSKFFFKVDALYLVIEIKI